MKENADGALAFLGPLDTLLRRGDVAYKNYMASGQTFLHAKIIKDNNERIRQLILERSHLLPTEYQGYAINLVSHIDIWHVLWQDLDAQKPHALSDRFAFENKATFPKESVASLNALYLELREGLQSEQGLSSPI